MCSKSFNETTTLQAYRLYTQHVSVCNTGLLCPQQTRDVHPICWYNVGSPSATLAQHCTNIEYWSGTVVCDVYVSLFRQLVTQRDLISLILFSHKLSSSTLPLPISHLCENYAKSTCIHAVIAMGIFHCVAENRQPEWSVTCTQCSLAFLVCVMCACA